MSDCIFCKIANSEIKTDFIYESEDVVAFRDINPAAPQHVLIIPRKHYNSVKEVDDPEILSKMHFAAVKIAGENGLDSYRLVINTGESAGQTVFHLHLHLLGGRDMTWPPG